MYFFVIIFVLIFSQDCDIQPGLLYSAGNVIFCRDCDYSAGIVIFSLDCDILPGLWKSARIVKVSQDCEIQSGLWNSAGIVKFSQDCKNSARIVKFSWDCEIHPGLLKSARIVIFNQDYELQFKLSFSLRLQVLKFRRLFPFISTSSTYQLPFHSPLKFFWWLSVKDSVSYES